MKKIESGSLAVMLDEETLGLRIEKDGVVWNTQKHCNWNLEMLQLSWTAMP